MPRTREPRTPAFPIRLTYPAKKRLRDLDFAYSRRGWRVGQTPSSSTNLSLAVARLLEIAEPYIDAYMAGIHADYKALVDKHTAREEYRRSPEYLERQRRRADRQRRDHDEQQRIERENRWRSGESPDDQA